MTDRDCPHGQLARSCNICDMEREIASQAQTIARLLEIEKAAATWPKSKAGTTARLLTTGLWRR